MSGKWTAPDRIYLQVTGEDPYGNHEVTWCQDRINKSDVLYRRADVEADRAAVLADAVRVRVRGEYIQHGRVRAHIVVENNDIPTHLLPKRAYLIPARTEQRGNDG